MNKCFEIGYIGKKGVELKFTPGKGTAVATFTISVPRKFNKDGQKEYDFIPVVVWGTQAEFVANNQDKIKRILVEGRIQTRNYDKDGHKVYVTELVVENIEVQEWKDAISTSNSITNSDNNDNFDDMTPIDDGDIPF